jgi:hypothetical protein
MYTTCRMTYIKLLVWGSMLAFSCKTLPCSQEPSQQAQALSDAKRQCVGGS